MFSSVEMIAGNNNKVAKCNAIAFRPIQSRFDCEQWHHCKPFSRPSFRSVSLLKST